MSVSVLVLTLDEEANISACIEMLEEFDDIVVLDSFSSDSTVEIAKKLGARVYQRSFDNFANQRNYALDEISFKYDWVLHLDADEILTSKLRAEIRNEIKDARYDAFWIPSKLMFFGKWLRYSGMYPTYQVRLGRLGAFRFCQVGHGQREDLSPERIGTLHSPYLHYSCSKGLAEWFEKHNRYSTDEALAEFTRSQKSEKLDWSELFSSVPSRRRRALKALSARLPFRPLLRFIYMYVIRRGFLDGEPGLTYCRLMAIYEHMIVVKLRELKLAKDGSQRYDDGAVR